MTQPIHSHFLINSVNFDTGKKLHIAKEQLQELRQRNDQVCMKFSLPVFNPTNRKEKTKTMSIGEYHTAARGQSKKLQLMNIINDCMRHASNREEFIALMESEGYKVRWETSRRNITYTTPSGWQCRDRLLFGDKYLKENMEYEFRIREEIIHGRAVGEEPTRADGTDYATASGAGSDTTARSASHESGVGGSASVKNILVEEAYTGVLINHRSETNGGKAKRLEQAEWYRHQNFFPVIIERDIWEKAQQKLKAQARPANGNKAKHRYARLILCKECGSPFVPMIRYWNGKRRVEYVCKGYHRNGKSYCSSHRIHEEVLDAAVQEFAQTMRIRVAEEQKGLKQKQKMWALRKPVLDAHILSLQKRIQELEGEVDAIIIDRIYKSENGNYTDH
mgnify:FL=1